MYYRNFDLILGQNKVQLTDEQKLKDSGTISGDLLYVQLKSATEGSRFI